MTVELVTGHSNQQHVSAVDEALKNIGVYGAGVYLLPDDTNNYPTISMYNANTVQIAACNMLIHGRHVRISTAENVTITSGQSGYKRIDTIVAHYKSDSDGNETVTFEAVKGTLTTGTPSEPYVSMSKLYDEATKDARIPIATVTVNGLTPSVEWTVTQISNLHNLDYRLTHSAPPVHVAKLSIPYHVGVVTLTRIGNIVYANGEFYANSDFNGNTKTNETVPAGYRPQAEYANPAIINAMSHMGNGFYLTLSADGTMYQYGATHMNYRYGLTGTWVTGDTQPS